MLLGFKEEVANMRLNTLFPGCLGVLVQTSWDLHPSFFHLCSSPVYRSHFQHLFFLTNHCALLLLLVKLSCCFYSWALISAMQKQQQALRTPLMCVFTLTTTHTAQYCVYFGVLGSFVALMRRSNNDILTARTDQVSDEVLHQRAKCHCDSCVCVPNAHITRPASVFQLVDGSGRRCV